MFRVAWWLVLAAAVNSAVWTAWWTLGGPSLGTITSTLAYYAIEFCVVAVLARRHLGDPWPELVPLRGVSPSLALPVLLAALGGFVMSAQSVTLFQALNVLPPEVFELAGSPLGSTEHSLFQGIVSGAVLPAVFEEAVFRGLVLHALAAAMGARRAIVISALLFAAVHFRIEHTLDTFVAGILYGWMFVRTGSLLPSMLAHFLHNSLCELIDRGILFPELADGWTDSYGFLPAWVALAAMALIVVGVIGFRGVPAYRATAEAQP